MKDYRVKDLERDPKGRRQKKPCPEDDQSRSVSQLPLSLYFYSCLFPSLWPSGPTGGATFKIALLEKGALSR